MSKNEKMASSALYTKWHLVPKLPHRGQCTINADVNQPCHPWHSQENLQNQSSSSLRWKNHDPSLVWEYYVSTGSKMETKNIGHFPIVLFVNTLNK